MNTSLAVQEPRSIWASAKMIVGGTADAMVSVTSAVSTTASIAETLADAGKMHANVVKLEAQGKSEQKTRELKELYEDIEL